mmetsp:Transcript_28400/g.68227  ORF Transcript_28400/g.68227 Transcript_28400/m.68227 type:complete len:146 (-) Transcript_28400:31-468(-)
MTILIAVVPAVVAVVVARTVTVMVSVMVSVLVTVVVTTMDAMGMVMLRVTSLVLPTVGLHELDRGCDCHVFRHAVPHSTSSGIEIAKPTTDINGYPNVISLQQVSGCPSAGHACQSQERSHGTGCPSYASAWWTRQCRKQRHWAP